MASPCLSKDQQNFECVAIASVDCVKLPLIDILDSHVKPVDLEREINSCPALLSGKYKLRQDQLNLCFLPPPAEPDYSTFDVSLLYTLIRNLCPSLKPKRGWGTQPNDTDIQIGDDVERLRLFRNNYYAHADSAAISETDFRDIWKELNSIINRMQSNLGCSVDYKQELLKIEHIKYNHAHLEECKRILDGYLYLLKETDDRDGPEIFIKGEDRVIFGRAARFEANVRNADLSCWQITWELEKHTEAGKQCIDTRTEKYSDSTKEILNIKSVCLEDEGKYQAVLSQKSYGNDYKVSSNSICLHVLKGLFSHEVEFMEIDQSFCTVHVLFFCLFDIKRQCN